MVFFLLLLFWSNTSDISQCWWRDGGGGAVGVAYSGQQERVRCGAELCCRTEDGAHDLTGGEGFSFFFVKKTDRSNSGDEACNRSVDSGGHQTQRALGGRGSSGGAQTLGDAGRTDTKSSLGPDSYARRNQPAAGSRANTAVGKIPSGILLSSPERKSWMPRCLFLLIFLFFAFPLFSKKKKITLMLFPLFFFLA